MIKKDIQVEFIDDKGDRSTMDCVLFIDSQHNRVGITRTRDSEVKWQVPLNVLEETVKSL